jgi:TonB family protein
MLLAAATTLSAQSVPDTARCRIALSAPARDSVTAGVSIRISPFDSSDRISKHYQSLIGLGIRQFFIVPQPLELGTYGTHMRLSRSESTDRVDTIGASLTLQSAYRAVLHRDGRITNVRAVGGTRDRGFDEAVVRAISDLGESQYLPPADAPAAIFRGDGLDIRIAVTPDQTIRSMSSAAADSAEEVTPLVRTRLPIRRITSQARPKGDSHGPRYPLDLRMANVEGKTVFDFVIDRNGAPMLSTVQVVSTTATQFVDAVLEFLPTLHFDPMTVEGCPVPVLVRMPFEFALTRR